MAQLQEYVRVKADGLNAESGDEVRTRLAFVRTRLAAENTYTAWLRTGLGALASGLGARALPEALIANWLQLWASTTFVMLAVFCFIAAVWRELAPMFGSPH